MFRILRNVASIAVIAAAQTCLPLDRCRDALQYRSVDLMDWCISSGECKFDGKTATCEARTQAECEAICQNSSPYCVELCVGTFDDTCRFTYAPIGGDMSWDYHIAGLGAVRDGLTVFEVTLGAGANMTGVRLQVSVGGNVLCTYEETRAQTGTGFTCDIGGTADYVHLDVIGQHPAFIPYPRLREPTMTQHVTMCDM